MSDCAMPDHEPDNPSPSPKGAAAGRAPTTTTTATRRAKRPRLAKKDPAIAHEASRKQFEVAEVETTIRGVEDEATKLRTQIAEANTRMEALKESHKQLGQELVDYRLGERTVLLEHTIKTIKKEDCLTELSHDSLSRFVKFANYHLEKSVENSEQSDKIKELESDIRGYEDALRLRVRSVRHLTAYLYRLRAERHECEKRLLEEEGY